jgi:hypothetical protein
MAVIQLKSKGFNEVQPEAQPGAEAGDISGVRWYFGLKQHNFHFFTSGLNYGIGIAYIIGGSDGDGFLTPAKSARPGA